MQSREFFSSEHQWIRGSVGGRVLERATRQGEIEWNP